MAGLDCRRVVGPQERKTQGRGAALLSNLPAPRGGSEVQQAGKEGRQLREAPAPRGNAASLVRPVCSTLRSHFLRLEQEKGRKRWRLDNIQTINNRSRGSSRIERLTHHHHYRTISWTDEHDIGNWTPRPA